MSKKVLAIFGATGQQGSSVIKHVLSDSALSSQYQIRAITRDTSSPKALLLASEYPTIELAQADASNPPSLLPALQNAHTVFAMTADSMAVPNAEFLAGKAIADAAVSAGAKYIIWSTLPSIALQTNGKYSLFRPFDEKFAVETYIREELYGKNKIQAVFLLPAAFMENFEVFMPPKFDQDKGKWVLRRANSPESKLALIAAVEDVGKFVGRILTDPEKFAGRTVNAVQGQYSMTEIAEAIGKAAGKEVVYEEISEAEFKQELGGGVLGDALYQLFRYFEEFGMYGPDVEEVVRAAVEEFRLGGDGQSTLMRLDQFFEKYPVSLDGN